MLNIENIYEEVVYLFQVSLVHVALQGIITLYVWKYTGYIVGLAKSTCVKNSFRYCSFAF